MKTMCLETAGSTNLVISIVVTVIKRVGEKALYSDALYSDAAESSFLSMPDIHRCGVKITYPGAPGT